jgi:hypothetical protein
VSPKRGERAAPPAVGSEFEVRFGNSDAAKGWDHLAQQAPGNLRRAFETLRAEPRSKASPDRQHRLAGNLGLGQHKGMSLERWQYEVTSGGRIWYLIDDEAQTLWIVHAGTGHPKQTD